MYLICESSLLEVNLCKHEMVDYSHPLVPKTIRQLHTASDSEMEHVSRIFEFLRDTIHHSWDIQNPQVTCKASEVLSYGEGYTYHMTISLNDDTDGICGIDKLREPSYPSKQYSKTWTVTPAFSIAEINREKNLSFHREE